MTRTVGVEEEFLLVGSSEPRPTPVGELVAESAACRSDGQYEHELKQEQAEFGTAPCLSVHELTRQLRERRAELAKSARLHGARLAALATSPIPSQATPTPDRRYQRMSEVFGRIVAPQLTCGMHVHVSVESPDEGVAVLDRIRPWLAPLLALSANSPFWRGEDTGYASYRSIIWSLWPTAGVTEPFGDVAGYERVREQLIASGAALDDGMLYFNARLSARYPTVELRIADVCPDVADAATIAALARALVTTAAAEWAEGRPPAAVRTELLRAASWRAARWGVAEELVNPDTATPLAAWSLIEVMVGRVASALQEAGDTEIVENGLAAIRSRGNGAELQRSIFDREYSLDAVVDAIAARTTG